LENVEEEQTQEVEANVEHLEVSMEIEESVDNVCYTCFNEGDFEIERLPNIYDSIVGARFGFFNFDCLSNMYKEFVFCVKEFGAKYHMQETDELFNSFFEKSVSVLFHFRHDLFSFVAGSLLQKRLSNPFGTELRFSEIFENFPSDRTPDKIYVEEDKVLIIETSVTSDEAKSTMQKGTDEKDSKYKDEILILQTRGFKVYYHANILDVNTGFDNFDELLQIMENFSIGYNRHESLALKELVKNLILRNRGFEKFGYIVFGDEIKWEKWIADKALLIKNNFLNRINAINGSRDFYKKKGINRSVFDKIIINREKLLKEIYSRKFDSGKAVLVVTDKNCFFQKNPFGLSPSTFINNLNSRDMFKLKGSIKWLRKGTEFDCFSVPPLYFFDKVDKREVGEKKPTMHDHCKIAERSITETAKRINKRINYIVEDFDPIEIHKAIESNQKLLANNELNEQVIKNAIIEYNKNVPKLDHHNPKAAFTLPFVDVYALKRTKSAVSEFMFHQTHTHRLIYEKFKNNKGLIERDVLDDDTKNKLKVANKKYNISMKEFCEKANLKDRITYKDFTKLLNKSEKKTPEMIKLENAHEELMKINKEGNLRKRKAFDKRLKLNKNDLESIKSEYQWVDKKYQGVNRGFSTEVDENDVKKLLMNCIEYMFATNEQGFLKHYQENIMNTGCDTTEMKALKDLMMKNSKDSINSSFNNNVVSMAYFVSNFIYTLCFFSKVKSKGDEFFYSNLGWEGANLFVRGGKSVNQTGDSRQFRLSYPIPSFIADNKNMFFSNSFKFDRDFNGKTFILTPWMNLNEKVLADMICFKEKVLFNLITYKTRVKSDNDSVDLTNLGFNFLLAFNNRRQTEVLLSDLRYPVVNSLGDFTGFKELMMSLPNSPSDMIQYFIISGLKKFDTFAGIFRKNYINNDKTKKALHLFTGKELQGVTDLTYMIYCTYMMTKAPYKQHIEQSKNLKGMMKIHEQFIDLCGKDDLNLDEFLDKTEVEEGERIFDNDLYFSKKYSFGLGKQLSERIMSENRAVDVSNDFYNTFTRGWYEIENDSGLRSDKLEKGTEDSFFGRKSHEVVTREMLNDLKNGLSPQESLNNISNSLADIFKKSRQLSQFDISFVDKINKLEQFKFTFHVVDKTQWKGSREIYVMTLKTKLVLNPMEAFFKKLCQKVENEIISVPSNKRLQMIHSQFYENKFMKEGSENFYRYNLTLDCRKWGPLTNYNKYMYFILGMSSILPQEFVDLFACVTEAYCKKQVYISPSGYKTFKNNEGNKKMASFLHHNKDLDTGYFNMPYSFVMGIFNYLSSLYHAEGQTFAIKTIKNTMLDNYGIDIAMKMNAHSDDSGGYLMIPKNKYTEEESNRRKLVKEILAIYEASFKFGNIFFSVKKCVVSTVYFELLSILYLKDQLLPMVPKFFGSLVLHPKLEGYAVDMAEGYSKIIELMCNGATFFEAFLAMRIYSEMVRSFYHMTNKDDDRPVSCYGGLYSHPLLVLLTGSRSDNIRLYMTDKKMFSKFQAAVMKLTGEMRETFNQKGLKATKKMIIKRRSVDEMIHQIKSLYGNWVLPFIGDNVYFAGEQVYKNISYNESNKMSYKVIDMTEDELILEDLFNPNNKLCIKIPEEILVTKNVDLKNNLTRLLTMANNKLRDASFLNSLSYVSNTRRLTETFTWASDIPLMTTVGMITQKNAPFLIQACVGLGGESNPFDKNKMIEINENKLDKLFGDILGDAESLYNYMSESIKGSVVFNIEENKKIKVKPAHIDISLNSNAISLNSDPSKTFYSDKESAWILGGIRSLKRQKKFISNRLKEMDFDSENFENFAHYCRVLEKTGSKEFYMYAYVSSGQREIRNFVDLISMLETNTFYGSKITKLFKQVKYNQRFESITGDIDPSLVESMKLLSIQSYIEENLNEVKRIEYKGVDINNWILKNSGAMASTLIPTTDEDATIGDLFWFYGWTKPQKRMGDKWGGHGEFIFIGWNAIWKIIINKNTLEKVSVNLHPSQVANDNEFKFMFKLLELLDIKCIPRLSGSTHEYVLSLDDTNVINREIETETHLCKVDEDKSLEFYYSVNPSKINNFHYRYNEIKLRHISCEFPMIIDNKDISNLPEQLINVFSNDEQIDESLLPLIKKFPEPPLYKNMIKGKLNEDYNFINAVRTACEELKLKYLPLAEKNLKELLGLNLNKEILPDDVYWLMMNNDSFENINSNYVEFLSDFIRTSKNASDELDWLQFIQNWGPKKVLESGITIKGKNLSWYHDCYWVSQNYPQDSARAVGKIEEAILDCFKIGLGDEFLSPDISDFQQQRSIDEKTMRHFFHLIHFEASLIQYTNNKRAQSRLSEFIYNIFIIIFADDMYYNNFETKIKEDIMLSSFPLNKSDPKAAAVCYYSLLNYIESSKDTFCDIMDYNNFEKNMRSLNDNEKRTLITPTTSHKNVKLSIINLPNVINLTKKLKNGEKTTKKISLYHEKRVPNSYLHPSIKKALAYSDSKFDFETKTLYNDSTNDLYDLYKNKMDTQKNMFKDYDKDDKIPVIPCVGFIDLGRLRSKYGKFLLICTELPTDLNLYREDVKVALGPTLFHEMSIVNATNFYIGYNLDFDICQVFGIKPYTKFINDSVNRLKFNLNKKIYEDDIKNLKVTFKDNMRDSTEEHLHNCEEEYKKYETNPEFIKCFYNCLNERNNLTDEILKKLEVDINYYNKLGVSGNMILEYHFEKILKTLDEDKTFNELVADSLQEILSNSIKNIEIDLEDNKERGFYNEWKPGKNDYSPIPKNSNLYHNLETVFGSSLSIFLNRGVSMTKKGKSSCLMELESKRLLYNSLYEKMAISQHDIKVFRLFIAWLKSIIIGCQENQQAQENDNKIMKLINKLDAEVLEEIENPDQYLSDESEYDYI
jgi:hypothetical protein